VAIAWRARMPIVFIQKTNDGYKSNLKLRFVLKIGLLFKILFTIHLTEGRVVEK